MGFCVKGDIVNLAENSERRASIRIKVELRVYYGPHHSKLLTGYSVDLSAGGLFLSATGPFEVNDIVKLKFAVPGVEGDAVTCYARVAWINPGGNQAKPDYPVGAGLQFVELAPENLASIKGFLEVQAVW